MNSQSQAIYVHNLLLLLLLLFFIFFKQRISILEDGASGEKVGDIGKVFVKDLFTI